MSASRARRRAACRRTRVFAVGVAVVALGSLALAGVATGWVPPAERLADLLAERNRTAQRTRPLRLAVVVKDGDGSAVAKGVATTEPGGSARLELTYRSGAQEVQERSGTGYRIDPAPPTPVAGDAGALPLLPPLAFLQASSPERILGLLRGMGGEAERVDLGIDANRDCWVIGGRSPGAFEDNRRPALWVALENRELIRIDTGDDVAYRIGPTAAFGDIRLPKWVEVRPSDAETLRLEFEALAAGAE